MISVIIDTNFLLIPYHFKVDIFSSIKDLAMDNIQFIIPEIVIQELEGIIETQRGKHSLAAKMALLLIESMKITPLKTKTFKTGDDFIIEMAKQPGKLWVATQDAALRKTLKGMKIPLITLRNKSHLVIENRGYD